MPASPSSRNPEFTRFPVRLNLPDGQQRFVDEATEAVKREYRSSVRWKRLRCRKVEPLSDQPGIFILEVGHSLEFDWTWEGAVAFRASDPNQFTGNIDASDDIVNGPANGHSGVWAGEVVEVDETNGRLYVSLSSPENKPCRGTFFVRPFEFLWFLYSLFCQPGTDDLRRLLPARLNATRGHIHPPVFGSSQSGLEQFEQMWERSWGVLWGPPGCGKTTNLGQQVSACLDGDERILVISTTNKATDEAAFAIGRFALPKLLEQGKILRIGKGAVYEAYKARGLTSLLRGTETDLLLSINSLAKDLEKTQHSEERAVLRNQIQALLRSMKDSAFNIFVSSDVKVVIATAFKAITLLNDPAVRSLVAVGEAPFTTVIIDEVGLMSRAVVSIMSLLAARRVVVVGDAKQLAPISKVSRVLPTSQATWLSSSCLSHLQRVKQVPAGVHLLHEQYRMHPQISRVVSHYQYEGVLCDAPCVSERAIEVPLILAGCPRALWYVLDEDGQDLPSIRAERGSGNRSWLRPATRDVLTKLFSDLTIRKANGLFITPFKAQARDIASYFAAEGISSWSSGTVHVRQGTEADLVVFDTVNAGSCGWPYDEWKRLVNVGLSRAREFVLLLASRAEMNEPYLRPLLETLSSYVLKRSGKVMSWEAVPARIVLAVDPQVAANGDLLGSQIALRKSLRPVMSAEQQRLCGYSMDGKPRLVRGVAGSGKTMVLAHWLQKTLQSMADRQDTRVWAVYANRSLQRLIADTIEEAWKAEGAPGPSPLERVQLYHVRELLQDLLNDVGLRMQGDEFDYDALAETYLERRPLAQISPRCNAMFIDEAQDMGPSLLKVLSALVEPVDAADPKSRAMNIFYDNAQNIYGRGTPKWSEMGLDMRGRSTVMKESFRSTRPITEFAVNVLYRLQPPEADPDHKELLDGGLIEQTMREGVPWWKVHFNQVDGPVPIFRRFGSLEDQIDALGMQVVHWIREEGVKPGDICILYNGKNIRWRLEQEVAPKLKEIGHGLTVLGERGWDRAEGNVLVSTSHSYKGYDSEIVVLAGVEQFIVREKGILANNLYVAMTRARSILAVYAYARRNPDTNTQILLSTLQKCMDGIERSRVEVEKEISQLSDFEDMLERIGPGHRNWLARLWRSYIFQQEPIMATDREILAEPLFWFQLEDRIVAFFGKEEPGPHTLHKLEDSKIEVIRPGQNVFV